jgi:hypothetical protein
MSLPTNVTSAWTTFAKFSPWDAMGDVEWAAYSKFVLECHHAKIGYPEVEELLIEGSGVDGAPEFLAGELAAGLEVGLRVLKLAPAPTAAPAAAATTAAPVEDAAAKAKREKAEAAKAAAAAKEAAMSKLSPEERKALGL